MQKLSCLRNRQESLFFRHILVLTYPILIFLSLSVESFPPKVNPFRGDFQNLSLFIQASV
jgi:hypothetical protein